MANADRLRKAGRSLTYLRLVELTRDEAGNWRAVLVGVLGTKVTVEGMYARGLTRMLAICDSQAVCGLAELLWRSATGSVPVMRKLIDGYLAETVKRMERSDAQVTDLVQRITAGDAEPEPGSPDSAPLG